MRLVKTVIGLGLVLSSMLVHARQASDSTLLSSVKSLTLYDGKKTSHRRVSAIPQLKCIGGNARNLYTVDVMRCQNSGSDYDREDIQWTCQASLPPEFKLGSTEVICEGYNSPDDPRILKGSCGVEYRLILTKLGEEVYGKNKYNNYTSSGKTSSIFSLLFWLAFIGVVVLIVYRIFFPAGGQNNPRGQNNRRRGGFFGGGGGGGFDGHDDPPPPYTPRGFGSKPSSSRYSQSSSNAWRPGFWTGAATGAAAGYAAGRRGGGNALGGNEWYGSGRSGSSGSASRMGSGSSSSPSSARYESTGFGGTTRR